ncbi:MAG: sulfotransferase [Anaerolineae bacterium]|nr:sulfotransferase [Anaerolineae bacterium]
MKVGLQGENLLFLISQPRAGSTLLQRILGSHPEIHTVGEPWLMLHPLYALRSDGHTAEYGASQAHTALQTFLESLPGGEEEYIRALRKMCAHLYQCSLDASHKRLFLDKTPRYYLIIPQLARVFPRARFIMMTRNPLSVLASILDTWTEWSLLSLAKYKQDLLQAPVLLARGIDLLGEKAIVVHYERLVHDPEDEGQRLCEALGIDFVPEMIQYGRHDLPRWRLGDPHSVYRQARPTTGSVEKWIENLHNPQVWRLASDYLQALDPEVLRRLGYDHHDLAEVLASRQPALPTRWGTFSLAWLLRRPAGQRNRFTRGLVWIHRSLHRDGVRRTIVSASKKVTDARSKSR